MKWYLNLPEETTKAIDNDGWFHTEDIGSINRQGFLWITGRIKSIIVTASDKNVYPEKLENLLAQSEYMSILVKLLLFGKRDWESQGEIPYAIIYPNMKTIKLLSDKNEKSFNEKSLYEFFSLELERLTTDLPAYKKYRRFQTYLRRITKDILAKN